MKEQMKCIAALLFSIMVFNFVIPTIVMASAEIEIPIGTVVLLSFQDTIHPLSANVGQKVFLTVVNDVEVGGKVVIKAGANAVGEISQSVKQGYIGKPATVGILLRSVEMVDGKSVPISGAKVVTGEDKQSSALIVTILCCILGLLMKGGDVEIPQGSTVEGTVSVNTMVEI